MPIIESVIISRTQQADGSESIHERHTDHNGLAHEVSYYAPVGFDVGACLAARADNIGAQIDRLETIANEAANFQLALSPVDFIDRFTAAEWGAFQELAKTDVNANKLWLMVNKSISFNRGNPKLIGGLQYLTAIGVLADGRIAEVLA